MSHNQRKGSASLRRRRGLPTDRFKRLEEQVQELKKAQLRRRVGKQYSESVDAKGNTKVNVIRLDKIAPVPVKRILAPVVIPSRLDDDMEYVERRFPKAAKNRRKLSETRNHVEKLQEEAVSWTKRINRANADVQRAEKKRSNLQNELANLIFQDDIMARRRQRGIQIEEEKQRLREREEEIRETSRYTKTLDRMLQRIWHEQITFERTMETYTKVLQAQKEETEEIEELARRMAYLRKVTNRRLAQTKEEIFDREARAEEDLRELRQVARARENLSEQYEQIQQQKQRRIEQQQKKNMSSKLLESWKRSSNKKKMRGVETELEGLIDKFRRIELVTGLKTEFDIVHRYFHQDE